MFGRLAQIFHDTLEVKREALSHVADNDLQLGESVERPGHDHSKGLHKDFLVPSISRTAENVVLVFIVVSGPGNAVVKIENLFGREAWMQVYRHSKGFGTRQHRLEIGMIKEFISNDSIGHSSHKAIFPNGAFQFVR